MFNMPSLRDKAMTITLKMSMYRPTKVDRQKTSDLCIKEGTSKYRVTKALLSNCAELKEARSAYTALASYVHDNTLPWCDDGKRLLPNASYFDFANKVGELKARANNAVQVLYQNWDRLVAQDIASFGMNGDPNDYPTADEMLSKWGIRTRFEPISSSSDFRIDMSEDDKKEMEEEYSKAVQDSSEYLLSELLTPIKKMVETLTLPEDKRGKRWFEHTLVGNVKDICERARKLNINGDQRVEEIVREAESILCGVSAETIKGDEEVAKDVASKMSDVESKLAQWF